MTRTWGSLWPQISIDFGRVRACVSPCSSLVNFVGFANKINSQTWSPVNRAIGTCSNLSGLGSGLATSLSHPLSVYILRHLDFWTLPYPWPVSVCLSMGISVDYLPYGLRESAIVGSHLFVLILLWQPTICQQEWLMPRKVFDRILKQAYKAHSWQL